MCFRIRKILNKEKVELNAKFYLSADFNVPTILRNFYRTAIIYYQESESFLCSAVRAVNRICLH